MRSICEGRTCSIVAQRLSTVRHADRILVMESGSHDEPFRPVVHGQRQAAGLRDFTLKFVPVLRLSSLYSFLHNGENAQHARLSGVTLSRVDKSPFRRLSTLVPFQARPRFLKKAAFASKR
jgi:hypothetical protein